MNQSVVSDEPKALLPFDRSNSIESNTEIESPVLPDVTFVQSTSTTSNSFHCNNDKESQPLLRKMEYDTVSIINNMFPDDPEFNNIIREVEQAIENGIAPQRISQGSSGSYFVKNIDGTVLVNVILH